MPEVLKRHSAPVDEFKVVTTRDRSRRHWRVACAASLLLAVAFGLWMQFNPAGPTATTWVDDITTFLVASLVAGGSAVKAKASTGRGRSGWTWITAGATSWALGEAIWGWYAVVRAEAVPSPGIADVFYLSAVPLVVVGIALLSSNSGQMTTAFRNICDGLIIAGSLLFISWSTALGVVYRSGGGSTLARIVDLAYPATDIVLCTAALSALSRVQRSRRRELGLMGLGLLAFAIADSAYTYYSYTNSYGNGNIFDTGYIVGYLLIFLATIVPAPPMPTEGPSRELSTAQTLLPYIPLGLAVMVTVARATTGGRFDALLVGIGAVTVSLVLVRQLLTVVENSRLARRLQSTVVELRERESELAHQASHDPLTGLGNRILFADRIDHALLRRERGGESVALMVCDLDDFKSVNDTLGHLAGDEVLREVAERLRSCTRKADTISRLGGDEFGLVLEDFGHVDATAETAARISEALRPPILVAGQRVLMTVSIGIALASRDVQQGRTAAARCGCGSVRGEGRREGPFRDLRHPDAHRRLQPHRAQVRPGDPGGASGSAAVALPAHRRHPLGTDHGRRGAGALAAPDPRPSPPRFVHPVRRGDGSHHGHRRRRARSGVRASRAMGQAGHQVPERLGQPVRSAAARAGPRGHGEARARRARADARPPHARGHRVDHAVRGGKGDRSPPATSRLLASRSPSTTSAPVTRRSSTSGGCRWTG